MTKARQSQNTREIIECSPSPPTYTHTHLRQSDRKYTKLRRTAIVNNSASLPSTFIYIHSNKSLSRVRIQQSRKQGREKITPNPRDERDNAIVKQCSSPLSARLPALKINPTLGKRAERASAQSWRRHNLVNLSLFSFSFYISLSLSLSYGGHLQLRDQRKTTPRRASSVVLLFSVSLAPAGACLSAHFIRQCYTFLRLLLSWLAYVAIYIVFSFNAFPFI